MKNSVCFCSSRKTFKFVRHLSGYGNFKLRVNRLHCLYCPIDELEHEPTLAQRCDNGDGISFSSKLSHTSTAAKLDSSHVSGFVISIEGHATQGTRSKANPITDLGQPNRDLNSPESSCSEEGHGKDVVNKSSSFPEDARNFDPL